MCKEVISDNLYNVLEEERTIDYYEKVVERKPEDLNSVPNKFKTYEIYKIAVIGNPNMIKNVPVQIITQKFVRELLEIGVCIPRRFINYVKLCVDANDNSLSLENISLGEINSENVIPEAVKNIGISKLENLFSLHTINLIKQYNIFTLGDLIGIVDTPILCLEYFGTTNYYDEIVNTVRILKCKYLNEDPIIDINDDQNVSSEFFKLLGVRVVSSFFLSFWKGKSVKDFFALMKKPSIKRELMRIRNFGKQQVDSLIERVNIVLDYYENNTQTIPLNQIMGESTESYEYIVKKYQRLKNERQQLDREIELVLQKIHEMEKKQGKGK